jgi:NADH-quinone oxidoreductase subunit N
MNAAQLQAFAPFELLGLLTLIVMLLIAFRRDHRLAAGATIISLLLSLLALPLAASGAPRAVTPLFVMDGYVLFYAGLVLASALVVAILSYSYLERTSEGPKEEYYILLLTATLGAALLPASVHFASFFLGLETLSVSLLGLIAYACRRVSAAEAGMKYLILAGASSAFLLFGMALIYARLGTMSFAALALLSETQTSAPDLYRLIGLAMILTGVGFKLSLVPFHMWAPDIYEGAPAPITGFVAVVSKIAVFAVLLRFFGFAHGVADPSLREALAVIAILSMLGGNLLALLQNNVKRLLAYSSIAHLGYLFVAFLAAGSLGVAAASYYLVAYAVMSLGAFGIVAILTPPGGERDADQIDDYRGLFRTRPFLAGSLALLMLSLAGMPPTMGFIAKVYVLTSGIGAGLSWLVIALVIGSVVGLYYYLRIIVAMAMPVPAVRPAATTFRVPVFDNAVIACLLILLVSLGAYPAPLITLVGVTVEPVTAVLPQRTAHGWVARYAIGPLVRSAERAHNN